MAKKLSKKTYSLCEAVADIAYMAGLAKYYNGDSRQNMADFIVWAQEFEEINKCVEWDADKDYITEIEKFAELKLKK